MHGDKIIGLEQGRLFGGQNNTLVLGDMAGFLKQRDSIDKNFGVFVMMQVENDLFTA